MNNIYFYQDADGAFDYIGAILHNARKKDKDFNESNYEWHIGIKIINDIMPKADMIIRSNETAQLFGIVLIPDYKNPTRAELWKNVTNE